MNGVNANMTLVIFNNLITSHAMFVCFFYFLPQQSTYPTYSDWWEARGLGAGGLHIADTVLGRRIEVDGTGAVGSREAAAVSWGRGLGETLWPVVVDY